ncbi:MAG: prepilin-type N-terminal cleavage/methylation domain-containing protein [Candidatus Taylorbacteria bacterium]
MNKSIKLFRPRSIRGFTLIEMLVVIAIIGILTGIIVTNLSGAKGKARDAKRVSDLSHIQLALQLYFDRCGRYPEPDGGGVGQGGNGQCNRTKSGPNSEYTMSDFIPSIPTPTSEAGQTVYGYDYDSIKPYTYVLYAALESPSAAVNDGLKAVSGSPSYSIGTKTLTCGDNTTAGSVLYCLGPN